MINIFFRDGNYQHNHLMVTADDFTPTQVILWGAQAWVLNEIAENNGDMIFIYIPSGAYRKMEDLEKYIVSY